MTNEEITRLRTLCDAATPGPWAFDNYEARHEPPCGGLYAVFDRKATLADAAFYDDARFIAAARTAIPALLDEIERLRAARRGIDQ